MKATLKLITIREVYQDGCNEIYSMESDSTHKNLRHNGYKKRGGRHYFIQVVH